jgi:hypothetical protein
VLVRSGARAQRSGARAQRRGARARYPPQRVNDSPPIRNAAKRWTTESLTDRVNKLPTGFEHEHEHRFAEHEHEPRRNSFTASALHMETKTYPTRS